MMKTSRLYVSGLKLLYGPALFLFGIFYMPHLFLRFGQAKEKGKLLKERFGYLPNHVPKGRSVWIHAVSVGEVKMVSELIRLLQILFPDLIIFLSTTTPTGQTIAKKMESERVRVIYFPLDFGWIVRKVLGSIKPSLIVILETEIWPNLIEEANRRGIPIGIMNGRISDRAWKRYQWAKPWFEELFSKMSYCLVRETQDEERFRSMGFPSERLNVTGNMKFDIEAERNPHEVSKLRQKWNWNQNQIIVGGSTHEGEEEVLIKIFSRLQKEYSNLKLVLAPRHIERVNRLQSIIHSHQLNCVLESRPVATNFDVLILDRVGILASYYGAADLVFVGGSLISHGGQNPIEPARERKAIFHGPYVHNFRDIYQKLDEESGACLVKNEDELYEKMVGLLAHPEESVKMGSRAFQAVDRLKGATQRNLMLIEPWLKKI